MLASRRNEDTSMRGPPAKRQRYNANHQQRSVGYPARIPSLLSLPFPSSVVPPFIVQHSSAPRWTPVQPTQQIEANVDQVTWKEPMLTLPSGIQKMLDSLKAVKAEVPRVSPLLKVPTDRRTAENLMDMRLLRIRDTSVISSLHSRPLCPHCGLSFSSLSDSLFDSHREWHLKKTLTESKEKNKKSKNRELYCTREDWVRTENADENGETIEVVPTMKTLIHQRDGSEEREKPCMTSEDSLSKSCSACGENFVEFFDDDNDEWMLRDCVQIGRKMRHPHCASSDFSVIDKMSTPYSQLWGTLAGQNEIKKERDFIQID